MPIMIRTFENDVINADYKATLRSSYLQTGKDSGWNKTQLSSQTDTSKSFLQ